MRNLKRALSVALASVMLLGMMVVGTSAAGFPDVKSTDNVEAIEVMQLLGIMVGNDKGEFEPAKAVTRNEMAVVMANLMGLKAADYAGTCIFTDVPAWAQNYVAACYANKIVSGTSATTYNGNATVTAAEASLMMLKVLGYFQYSSDFGDDWKVATIKQASKISLLKDISGNADTALTRNNVAKLGLNALKATMVEAVGSDGVKVEAGGATITTGSSIKYEKIEQTDDYRAGNEDKYQQLVEKLFDDDKVTLATTGAKDDLGRPANKWTYKKDSVTVGKTADYTFVATKAYAAGKLLAGIQDKTDNDDLDVADPTNTVVVINNGTAKTVAAAATKTGAVIEVYEENDVISNVVVLEYTMDQIDDDSTNLTKAQKEDGATAKIKVGGRWYTNDKIVGYTDDYVEDAYILYIEKADHSEIVASQLAKSVEGKVTALRDGSARIDGAYYKDVTATTSVAVGDEGTFYLNMAGQIELVDTTSTRSDNYAYIYTVDVDKKLNSDGIEATTATAYMVLADGTKANYVVDSDEYDVVTVQESSDLNREIGVYVAGTNEVLKTTLEGTVVAYSVNSDKELEFETAKDTINAAASLTVSKNAADGTDSKTEFIFIEKTATKVKTSVATGYKNVSISAVSSIKVTNSDSDVLYVFVTAKNGSVTTDANMAVLLDNKPVVEENADGDTIKTFTVAIDGEETELTAKGTALDSVKLGAVFAYEMEDGYAKIDEGASFYYEDSVASATSEYVVLASANSAPYSESASKQYNLGGDEVIYTITIELKDSAVTSETDTYGEAAILADTASNIDSVTISEGGKIEAENRVVYTLDSGDLDMVFVYEYIY